jgi:adenylate cyclase
VSCAGSNGRFSNSLYSGTPEGALECVERALRLSPLDPMNFNNYVGIGSAHEYSGRYDEALTFYRPALHERPQILWMHRHTVVCMTALGRTEEAAEEMKRLRAAYPDLTVKRFREAVPLTTAVIERMAEYLRQAGLPE